LRTTVLRTFCGLERGRQLPFEHEHGALLRQTRLDDLVQIVTGLAERERECQGSVPDLLTEAQHSTVRSWIRLVR
jgi:hypothetical protein